MNVKKVLILAYYWPPSGGAGVQRWLKLTKYLAKQNVKVYVVTVDDQKASYMTVDHSLEVDVHPDVEVFRTDSFEPINYYSKLVGKSNVPTAGFSNVDNAKFSQKAVNFLRSNLFIPDPRVGWNKYALRKAEELIREQNIGTVITSSPPHSTQLVGLSLKRKFQDKIHWIADFRDPWTDIYYYHLLGHSAISHRINLSYEKKVIEQADRILTVGDRFRDSLISKTNKVSEDKFVIISNGFDPDDFREKYIRKDETTFSIIYTGTMSEHYKPEVFFKALGSLVEKYPNEPIQFTFVGIVAERIKRFAIDCLGTNAVFVPPVKHDRAVEYMLAANVLFLVTQGEEGTIPGKTFEYLASGNRIICIGKGDASEAIKEFSAGASFERNQEEELFVYLEKCLIEFKDGKSFQSDLTKINQLSREEQARQLVQYIR